MPGLPAGERLQSWSRILKVSVREMSRRTGLSRSKVGRILSLRQEARADELERLVERGLCLSMREFYGEMERAAS